MGAHVPSNGDRMVDIHCHMIPGIDDGARDLEQAIQMARIATDDGIGHVIVTPHQLGSFGKNSGELIRTATASFQRQLDHRNIPLRVAPGADVRIEDGMCRKIATGDVLSLADHRRAVLLELPHELYFPIEPVLSELERANMQGILSHPERNEGLLRDRRLIPKLVDQGCLMQVTAGSISGSMGPACRELAHWMLREGLVHFVATDAHGTKSRRPRMSPARREVTALTSPETAMRLFVENPRRVARGDQIAPGRLERSGPSRSTKWFRFGKAA